MEKNNDYELLILYGTQTGTAESVSEELERELISFGYKTKILSLDEYDIENLPEEKFVIFIVSTTGYGEIPSNMIEFWDFLLRKDLPENSLINVNYTIFGLGDSSYVKFNQVAKMLNYRLKNLSANLFHPIALGDDQHDFGWEAEFDPWNNQLIQTLNDKYFDNKKRKENFEFIPKYEVKIIKNEIKSRIEELNQKEKIIHSKVTKCEELTKEFAVKQVFLLQMEYNSKLTNYTPGDVVKVYPRNCINSINEFITMYKLSEDDVLIIENKSNKTSSFPHEVSVVEFLTYWLNINGVPSRYFCKIAQLFTDYSLHKEKLELFNSKSSV